MSRAELCPWPASSKLRQYLMRVDYVDSFEIPDTRPELSLVGVYAAALDHLPTVFKHLLVARSALVKPFGIAGVSHRDLTKRIDNEASYSVGDKLGRWTIFAIEDGELITGANDKHLDFRVSVLREPSNRIVLSTAVMTHNRFGRRYLATVLPFHKFGVAQLLSNASRAGRI